MQAASLEPLQVPQGRPKLDREIRPTGGHGAPGAKSGGQETARHYPGWEATECGGHAVQSMPSKHPAIEGEFSWQPVRHAHCDWPTSSRMDRGMDGLGKGHGWDAHHTNALAVHCPCLCGTVPHRMQLTLRTCPHLRTFCLLPTLSVSPTPSAKPPASHNDLRTSSAALVGNGRVAPTASRGQPGEMQPRCWL